MSSNGVRKSFTNQSKDNPNKSVFNILLEYAIALCRVHKYSEAQQFMRNALEQQHTEECKITAKYWILRAEIAEELNDLQEVVYCFETAAKYEAQPFHEIVDACYAMKSRTKALQTPIITRINRSAKLIKSKNDKKSRIENVQNQSQAMSISNSSDISHILSSSSNSNSNSVSEMCTPIKHRSDIISYVISPNNTNELLFHSPLNSVNKPSSDFIISPQRFTIPSTPLTNDLYKILKQLKHKKENEFRFENNNNIDFKNEISLSPIISSVKERLSSVKFGSFRSDESYEIFRPQNLLESENESVFKNNDPLTTDHVLSQLKELSFIESPVQEQKHVQPTKASPVLISILKNGNDRCSISSSYLLNNPIRLKIDEDSFESENTLGNVSHLSSIVEEDDVWSKRPMRRQNVKKVIHSTVKCKKNVGGSYVKMEVLSAADRNIQRYGSPQILSPVRRSVRLKEKREMDGITGEMNISEMLRESNYTFVPNRMLSPRSPFGK